MKLPRDIGGRELARQLSRYGYAVTRRSGSHIQLTTHIQGEHHVTIPAHEALRAGTLSGIVQEVARHLSRDKAEIMRELWGQAGVDLARAIAGGPPDLVQAEGKTFNGTIVLVK